MSTLASFKQIRSAFHPEAGSCSFNEKYKRIIDPFSDSHFDEVGIATRSRYYPVRMYNK